MAAMVKLWFLLMLPINTSLFHIQEPQYVVGTKGLRVTLQMMCRDLADVIFLYRSDQQRPPFPNEITSGQTTNYVNYKYLQVYISENQEFLSECWKEGTLLEKKHFYVIACAEKAADEKMSLYHGVAADIVCQKFNSSHGETLQVLRTLQASQHISTSTIILDTNVSLEILPDQLRGRIQVLNNRSLIHFSDVLTVDIGLYSCLVWSDNQCQNYKEISLDVEQDIFLKPGESFTLPCLAKDVTPVTMLSWWTPVTIHLPGIKSEYDTSEMLNDKQTGNYSLVISHLTLNHTGTYTCKTFYKNYNVLNIFVCSDLEPINVTFSLNDTANLTCHPNLKHTLRVQWYWEYNQSAKYLLTDSQGGFVNEMIKDRLNVFNPQSYITISKLLIRDGGLYWCRVWGIHDISRGLCFKRKVYLTYAAHYEDTVYIVYASVMAIMLLAMIVIVVCVTVVSTMKQTPREI